VLQNDTNGCIQFARSSSDQHTTRPTLTFFPFAKDTVTYATRTATIVPPNRTIQQLHDLYTCAFPTVFQPVVLPSEGSDLRRRFLDALMIDMPNDSCVIDTLPNGTPIAENDGRQLQDNSWLIPYSVAQYTTQTTGVSADRHGVSILRGINGLDPRSETFPAAFVSPVFNVVRTADRSDSVLEPLLLTAFGGSNSQVCQDPSLLIERYGFKPISNCGFGVN
jgi:hypothetical protein